MFERPDIFITQEIYETSGVFMLIVRYFGLFPMKIRRQAEGYLLKWSSSYAVYSFILGLFAIGGTYEGYLGDVLIGRKKSIRMKTKTEILVTFVDLSAVMSILFCGVFVTPNKYNAFRKLIKCFNKVDSIIPLKNLKSVKRLSAFMIIFYVFGIFLAIVADTAVYLLLSGSKIGISFVIKSYSVYYVAYHIAYAALFSIWKLLYSVYRRARALSEELENILQNKNLSKLTGLDQSNSVQPKRLTAEYVIDLMVAYGKLCDSSKAINELIGHNILMCVSTVLLHEVLTLYFFIMSLYRDKKDMPFNVLQIAWVLIHFSRLLTVVFPCYYCEFKIQNIKASICKLRSYEIDDKVKEQLDNFLITLHLRKFEITAKRLAIIDASLVTSIVSATTTYLMLLVQIGVNDKTA